SILATNGQTTAKVYVPRSIQRIKDTEKVAFVKSVDLEIPESRITEALKDVGLDVVDVIRLTNKVKNIPAKTIKIAFNDPQNRNTFIRTRLQIDSMHFEAEAAMQNTKPVQCYICLKYNHVAKHCKTKQQIYIRCGENNRIDQCTAASDAMKCCNCKDSHLATSNECATYKEQEKRMHNLVNQYSSTNKPTTTAPAIHDINEFPLLPIISQRHQEYLHNELFDEIINVLSSKMKKIIEETTSRNDRAGKLGGEVLLAVKQHIKCREVLNKTSDTNEIIAIEVETQLFKSILIASIYVPPTAKMDLNIFQELYNINNNCIIVGDLNATLHHMRSAKANARERQLQELFKEGFIEGVDDDTPTFEKNDYEVKLDWLLGSQPLLSFTLNVDTQPPIGTSCGHKPLTFDISIGAEPKPASPRMSFNFKAAKWSKFRSKLDEQLMLWNNDRRLDSALDIEEYTSFITNSILVATQEAIPLSKQTNTRPMINELTKSLGVLIHHIKLSLLSLLFFVLSTTQIAQFTSKIISYPATSTKQLRFTLNQWNFEIDKKEHKQKTQLINHTSTNNNTPAPSINNLQHRGENEPDYLSDEEPLEDFIERTYKLDPLIEVEKQSSKYAVGNDIENPTKTTTIDANVDHTSNNSKKTSQSFSSSTSTTDSQSLIHSYSLKQRNVETSISVLSDENRLYSVTMKHTMIKRQKELAPTKPPIHIAASKKRRPTPEESISSHYWINFNNGKLPLSMPNSFIFYLGSSKNTFIGSSKNFVIGKLRLETNISFIFCLDASIHSIFGSLKNSARCSRKILLLVSPRIPLLVSDDWKCIVRLFSV
ncbi:unnamed protein product, partial [Rotaria sordida]